MIVDQVGTFQSLYGTASTGGGALLLCRQRFGGGRSALNLALSMLAAQRHGTSSHIADAWARSPGSRCRRWSSILVFQRQILNQEKPDCEGARPLTVVRRGAPVC